MQSTNHQLSTTNHYDLVIIGGGPTGINCAIEASKRGLNYVVLEKGVLVNSLYNFPANMTFFSTAGKLEIADVPFVAHGDKPTRGEALEYYRRLLEAFKLNIRTFETVQKMTAVAKGYEIKTDKNSYRTHSVIVATGFYDTARLLHVPGENLPKVKHFYDDAHPYVGKNVLVVGAANSACDIALETFYKGAKSVTMAIRSSEIYPKVKYWIRPNIENRIKEGSIKAYFNTTVKEIFPDRVLLDTPAGEVELENDFVLAMTGYKPNYALIDALGLPVSDDENKIPLHDSQTLETPLPNVYVAGVVAAGMKTSTLFIENTRFHGELIADRVQAKTSEKNAVAVD